ncbi:hypothetical protein L2724_08260 [Limosilactobacillus vaginalis]|uniref:Uncharacterized protein n=1 Tax=Limosilactobacillus vaginalis TaxID=1633 RepID=A0AAW5WV26_9LACO|nr:hypothetical protein [Limosilactobacillus vaginalis]MCZ3668260.1 hypothetical protein [Limosilactobacillus vaginalis]
MTHLTMNNVSLTTHRKLFTYLIKNERVMIATLKNDGLSNRAGRTSNH